MENPMIMLITYRPEFREQLDKALHAKGHETCVAPHRQDVVSVMKDSRPRLVVLDLYLSDPSGLAVLKTLREHGYHGRVVVLSGKSMTSVVHDAYPIGIDKVLHVPEEIGGQFEFGELESAIETCLEADRQHERDLRRARIAQRAHELYELGGRREGGDVHDWLRAEQELAS
jgi:DNA-binding response OmpR family regulator